MSSQKIRSYFIIFKRNPAINSWMDEGSEEFENKSIDELISDSISRMGIDGYYGGTITGLKEIFNIPLDILSNLMEESMRRGKFILPERIRSFRYKEIDINDETKEIKWNEKIMILIGS